ncbi:MAG TPA: C-terminal binding protein [Pyrinomonadaceae bacterium]|jgi:phosphoglycerate dehydrogenase-like enzyme
MRRPVIVYTDLPWALGADGRVDPSRATIEREVFGHDAELRFPPASGGQYQTQGPQFLDALRGADALVIYRCQITEPLLDAAGESLRVVARQGVGFDNLAPDLLEARGVIGFNIPDYCVDEVVTHTMSLLLALERGVIVQHLGLTGGKFDIYAGGAPRRLGKRTVGIVGFGRIGRAVSARLRLFYGRVVACDPYVAGDLMDAYGVEKVTFEALLADSDAVLLHCLLNDETAGMLNAAAFEKMRPGAFLINCARGGLVESRALYEALSGGRIAGAGLDVFLPENPWRDEWYSRVLKMPNVVVTSHRAFLSEESQESQRRRASEGVLQVLRTGRPPAAGHVTQALEYRANRARAPLARA